MKTAVVGCLSMLFALGCSSGGGKPYEFGPELPTWARTYGCYTFSAFHTSSARAGLQLPDDGYLVVGQSNWTGDPGGSWFLSLTGTGQVNCNHFIAGYRLSHASLQSSGAYLMFGETTDYKSLVRVVTHQDNSTFEGQAYEIPAEFWHLYSALDARDGSTVLLSDLQPAEELFGQPRVMKLSPDGAVIWERGYTSAAYKDLNFIDGIENPDGSYAIAGTVDISPLESGNANRFLLARIDPNGGVNWARYYEDERNKKEWATAVASTPKGGLVAVGATEVEEATDILVVKLDKKGQLVWRKLIENPGGEQASDVVVRPDGLIVVLGNIVDEQNEYQDIWLVALASDGSIRWQRAYDQPGSPGSASITMTSDGGFLIVGSSKVVKTQAYAVMHVDGEGQIEDSACTMIRETTAQAVETAASAVEVTLDIDAGIRSTETTISGASEEQDLYGLVDCGQGDPIGPEWGEGTVGDSCDCSPANKCVGPQTGCQLGLTCIGHYTGGGTPIGDCSHWCASHANCPEPTTCHLLSVNNVNMGMWCY
jgi:hypothetical protein